MPIDWNKRGPLTNAEVKEYTDERLADMASGGIKAVSLLGSPNDGENCQTAITLQGALLPIAEAVSLSLPLPGCDMAHCKCIWLAKKVKLLCAIFALVLLACSAPAAERRCTGKADCTACVNCSSCRYCQPKMPLQNRRHQMEHKGLPPVRARYCGVCTPKIS